MMNIIIMSLVEGLQTVCKKQTQVQTTNQKILKTK